MHFLNILSIAATINGFISISYAFNHNCNSNYVSYYGQNSARNQKTLGEYCADSTEDVIVLAFMNGFPNVILNFANACETTFEGSTLLHCPNIAKDIKLCQSKGKAVVLSMGGAAGSYGFSSDSEATKFADTVWNMFFKGKAERRPFDDAVLDGIDLDIEGGSGTGYSAFINQLRSHYASDPGRKYYIAAAPQCPYPDAYLGSTLNSAWFDMVYVQFYNNYCGLNTYPGWFNYEDWDTWAKTKSMNKDVKVYIGAPGSPSAASSGFVDNYRLQKIYNDIRSKYSSLGGVMTWDVSQARTSGIANTIRSFLDASGVCMSPPEVNTTTVIESSTESSTEPTSSSSTSVSSDISNSYTSTTDTGNETDSDISTIVVTTTVTISLSSIDEKGSLDSSTKKPHVSDTSTSQPISNNPLPSEPSDTNHQNTDYQSDVHCPVNGESCNGNIQGCTKEGYVVCSNNRWYVYPCAAGTRCNLYESVAICGWPNEATSNTCSLSIIYKKNQLGSPLPLNGLNISDQPLQIYSSEGTNSRIEFVMVDAADGRYKALVKMQTLFVPYSNKWVLSLQLPHGFTMTDTNRGVIKSGSGGKVTISSIEHLEPKKNMAIFIEVYGNYHGTYRYPLLSFAKVDSF